MAVGKWRLREAKNFRADELDKLFAGAKKEGPRTHLAVSLGYNGAFRVSELIHLRVSDFNWQSSIVLVLPLKKAGKRRVRGDNGKVRIVDRDLPDHVEYPLPENVMALVKSYVKAHKLGPNDWLFPGRASKSCKIVKLKCPGGHVTKRRMQQLFDRLLERLKIKLPGRGIHSLKHARLTEVAQKTKDPYLVKEIGRHDSVAMSDHYVKYLELRDKVKEIGGRL